MKISHILMIFIMVTDLFDGKNYSSLIITAFESGLDWDKTSALTFFGPNGPPL